MVFDHLVLGLAKANPKLSPGIGLHWYLKLFLQNDHTSMNLGLVCVKNVLGFICLMNMNQSKLFSCYRVPKHDILNSNKTGYTKWISTKFKM